MTADQGLRHYLLGTLSEEEHLATEQRYFDDEASVEAMEGAEEALIEDYLAGLLSADERSRFERVYLATPGHRRRVETIRQLTALASQGAVTSTSAKAAVDESAPAATAADKSLRPQPTVTPFPAESSRAARSAPQAPRRSWAVYAGLAAAAAVLLAVGLVWMRPSATSTPPPTIAQAPAPAPVPAPSVPDAPAPSLPSSARILAVSLSPIQVRGAGETPAINVPPDADLLELRLEGEGAARPENGWRVTVSTVGGDEVWQGSDVADGPTPGGVVARVQIPAARLAADDYVVSLSPADAQGSRSDRYRYFLRVQRR